MRKILTAAVFVVVLVVTLAGCKKGDQWWDVTLTDAPTPTGR